MSECGDRLCPTESQALYIMNAMIGGTQGPPKDGISNCYRSGWRGLFLGGSSRLRLLPKKVARRLSVNLEGFLKGTEVLQLSLKTEN